MHQNSAGKASWKVLAKGSLENTSNANYFPSRALTEGNHEAFKANSAAFSGPGFGSLNSPSRNHWRKRQVIPEGAVISERRGTAPRRTRSCRGTRPLARPSIFPVQY